MPEEREVIHARLEAARERARTNLNDAAIRFAREDVSKTTKSNQHKTQAELHLAAREFTNAEDLLQAFLTQPPSKLRPFKIDE